MERQHLRRIFVICSVFLCSVATVFAADPADDQPASATAKAADTPASDADDLPPVPSHYEQLKELEWMIGTWIDQDDQARVETTCQWTRNQNFISRSFTVFVEDKIDMAGMQIIGWDPVAKQIRSWVFDSDGGFADGRWTRKGNHWYVATSGTLPDGRKAASTNIITYVDNNKFKWQSVNRSLDGRPLPNIDEVVIVRAKPAE